MHITLQQSPRHNKTTATPNYREPNASHLRRTDKCQVWLTDRQSAKWQDTEVRMAVSSVILPGNEVRTHMAITHYVIRQSSYNLRRTGSLHHRHSIQNSLRDMGASPKTSFSLSTALFQITAELSRFCEIDKVEAFWWAVYHIIKKDCNSAHIFLLSIIMGGMLMYRSLHTCKSKAAQKRVIRNSSIKLSESSAVAL